MLDSPVVEEPLGPLFLVCTLQTLRVELSVEVLEQLDSHHTVVGGFVECNGCVTDLWVLRVNVVGTVGVKDLVDALSMSVLEPNPKFNCSRILTMVNRHLAAAQLP